MKITKQRKNRLIRIADDAIRQSPIYGADRRIVSESYNGQIAAFSVAVALSGLKPEIAIYYSGKGSSDVDKKKIIELLADMHSMDKPDDPLDADGLFNRVIATTNEAELRALQKELVEYSIALKLVIRTFKFRESNG